MKIFATNRTDNKHGFYRIIQPLRMLKRSGWEATTVPFSGKDNVSVLPVNDSLLVRLSKGTDFILTSIVMSEAEILRIMNLRRHNNCRWIVDVSENIYANPAYQVNLPIIQRSLMFADGVITSTQFNKELYEGLNENIYVLPSVLDFKLWDTIKPVVSRKFKIGYMGRKEDLELVSPTFKEIVKHYPVELVNAYIDGVIGQPQQLAKLGLSMAVMPLTDTNYNRCRNNIDLLELMALRVPLIASPTISYAGLPIIYAKTNYEWYESVEKLIVDKQFRKEMGENEQKFVKNEYDMTKFVSNLQHWLKNLPKKDY